MELLADGDPGMTDELPLLQIAALSWSNRLGQPAEPDQDRSKRSASRASR
jgi:hypothetical protein